MKPADLDKIKGPASAATDPDRGSKCLTGHLNMDTNSTAAAERQVKALLADSTGNADRLKRSVQALTEKLAARMKEIHGHDYRVQIDHTAELEFVLIVPGPQPDEMAVPKRGEAA